MKELISIVVPVYNVEKYLKRCLDSIILQTYSNIEIIIINDGSTDNSLQICKDYEKQDKRVKVYSQSNGGLSSARNKGIELAKGQYIGFIDSDDIISPLMFEYLYKSMKESKSKISICNFIRFSDNAFFESKYTNIVYNKNEAIKELLIDRNIASHAVDKLYSKELFNDIKFPISKKYEDILTTYKLFMQSDKISYVPVALYGYYYREDSITGHYNKKTTIDLVNAVNDRYNNLYGYSEEINNYLNMNKINTILRCFLDIAMYDCKGILKDKEYKDFLYNELDLSKKINTRSVKKINTKKKNILNKLLFLNPNIFLIIMTLYYKRNKKRI